MSFSVSIKKTNIEYSGSGLSGIFANRLNLLNFKFLIMIKEIRRMNHISAQNGGEIVNENFDGVPQSKSSSLLHADTTNSYSPGGSLVKSLLLSLLIAVSTKISPS